MKKGCIFAVNKKQTNKNKSLMKTIKQGNTEIKVTAKVYGSYSIRNNKLVIYKGYKTNIYYLTYANVVIFEGYEVLALLDSFDNFINEIDGLDNQLRYVTDKVNKPIYRVITKDNETISIYKVLAYSDKIEMLETSEYCGGKYAIFNKETKEYKFGLSFVLANYIFTNQEKQNQTFEIGTKVNCIYLGLQTTGTIIDFNPNKSNANIKFSEPINWGNDIHYTGWVELDNPYLKTI